MMSNSSFQINLIRVIFLIVAVFAGIAVSAATFDTKLEIPIWVGVLSGLALAWLIIYFEHLSRRFTLRGFSRATFGLMIGIFCAWLLNKLPIQGLLDNITKDALGSDAIMLAYGLITYLVMGFLGVVVSLRSGQEDFAFIIPYIRFRQSNGNDQIQVLDTSALDDSRLIALINTGVIEGNLLVPQFVLEELNLRASSADSKQRDQAKIAIESLNKLRQLPQIKVSVSPRDESSTSDSLETNLIRTAKTNNAKLITTNKPLTESARLQEVSVLNIDEVEKAVSPSLVIGDQLELAITRTGKEPHQGVGYLPNGSMIVVNHAADHIGSTQRVVIISKMQSGNGQLIFAELFKENV